MQNMFYISLEGGNCSIIQAPDKRKALKWAKEEFGRNLSPKIREASVEEVAWVTAMGGRVHILKEV